MGGIDNVQQGKRDDFAGPHFAAADGEENGTAALADGGVEISHYGVKGVAGAARLAHDGLGLLQLRPDPRHLHACDISCQ